MKLIFRTLSLSFLLASFASIGFAQLTPQPSSSQTIVQGFGLGTVTVSYSRPLVKGRVIFGDLVPYNEIWRTGANSATTIAFTDEVNFGGQKIAAGKYALFTIPGDKEWVIVLNKAADQWGAYTHKDEDDVLRVKVKPLKTVKKIETFTIAFDDVTPGSMDLNLAWDNTQVRIPLAVDYDSRVMANIEKAMQGDKKPYLAAAQYYFNNNKDLKQALAWISEAEKTDTKAPWIKLQKAKIQLKMGDKSGAKVSAAQGLAIATEIKNAEYVKLNQQFLNDLK